MQLHLQKVTTRDGPPDPDLDELTCQVTSLGAYLGDFGFFKREHFEKLYGIVLDHLRDQVGPIPPMSLFHSSGKHVPPCLAPRQSSICTPLTSRV